MKLAIHQPEFLPWLGFFNKMASVDRFVLLDHVQFKKRYFENRNSIVSPTGVSDLVTVPVISKGKYTQPINQVEIDHTSHWQKKICNRIRHWYGKSPFFNVYFPELEDIFFSPHTHLLSLNMALIYFFRKALGITTELVSSSQSSVETFHGSNLILQLCLQNRAETYYCGPSGRDYLDLDAFERCGIRIVWLDYQCPQYKQLANTFVPNLSTLDLLFNHGSVSLDILRQGAVASV